MKESRDLIRLIAVLVAIAAFTTPASAQKQPFRFAGAECSKPPVLHCPDKDCPGETVINGGPVVETKTGRNYFLDYPCDLKKGEKVTFIYTSGQHELPATGLPGNSRWAEKLKCGSRIKRPDISDVKAGYVYSSRQQANPNPVWGSKPRPGTAEVFVYPKCENGLVVADIIRIDKGHTEGLEPKVTEEIVKMMLSAKSGKLQKLR